MSHREFKSDVYASRNGETIRWYTRTDLEAGTPIPANEVSRALWDLGRAERRGFTGCRAVFVDFRYDGLDEAQSPESLARGGGWGRGQDVTYRHRVVKGKLVRDRSYPVAPPAWKGEFSGLRCEIRANHSGALCGYVTVPRGHPFYGKGYDGLDIEVHGGLTYASKNGKGWEFGFDCSHCDDAGHPEYEHGHDSYLTPGAEYRDIEYVKGEVASLARQLAVGAA